MDSDNVVGVRMFRRLILLAAVLGCWLPLAAYALGLGPITMRSALNQPLLAEIDIHSAQPGDLDGLTVKLASDEDFKRVKVERNRFLTKIKFKVAVRNDGSPYIQLITKKAVTEPYLDFLIEARWARGRALKEYTVLVDPPVLTQETPAPVQQSSVVDAPDVPVSSAQLRTPPRQLVVKPRPQSGSSSKSAKRRNKPNTPLRAPTPTRRFVETEEDTGGSGNTYRVQRNDTLFDIAKEMRPDSSVSVNQMMMALLKANPGAFFDNNINKLKAGVVLRMDDPSAPSEMSRTEANQAFRSQMSAWRDGSDSTRLVQQVEEEDAGRAASFEDDGGFSSGEEQSARLKLVAPGQEGVGTGSAGKESDARSEKLQDELILATEALDANRAETDELKTRLVELEEQLSSMQRLINLKDEEMVSLQNTLKGQQDARGEEPELAAEQPKAEEPAKAEKPKADVANAEEAVIEEELEDVLGSLFDDLLSDTVLLGILGLITVGIVGWLVIRRRRMQEGFEESILNVGMADSVGSARNDMGSAGESGMVSDFAMSGMDSMQPESAEVDPVSEADVYLAYGRHQQAEDIIKTALDSDPDRLELRAKLLEVMSASGNSAGFEEQAQILHDKVGGDESNQFWIKTAALGSQLCPDNALFGGSGLGSPMGGDLAPSNGMTADEEDLLDFDFDENESFDASPAKSATPAAAADDDLEFDVSALDFDMDMDMDVAETPSLDADDNSLDFDMSVDDVQIADATESQIQSVTSQEESLLSLEDEGGFEFELDSNDSESTPAAAPAEVDDFDIELDLEDDDDGDDIQDTLAGLADDDDEGLDDDIFADVDEIGTKLDLAKAYVDMGDSDGARSILDEVLEEGDDSQKQQAEQLLSQMG